MFICETLKYCWPTCIVVYNHRGCAMKFWLPDVILKLFAPVMEMHYTTNTRYGRENWITTSKFKISVGDVCALAIRMLLKGVGNVHKGLFVQALPGSLHCACSSQHAWLCAVAVSTPSDTVGENIIPLLCSHVWLGGPWITVGKVFKSTWMAWSALCHFWARFTCPGTAVHRKIMCFVCQCSQEPLEILPPKILAVEGLLDLSGCDGFYLLSCCSFCCQLIQI